LIHLKKIKVSKQAKVKKENKKDDIKKTLKEDKNSDPHKEKINKIDNLLQEKEKEKQKQKEERLKEIEKQKQNKQKQKDAKRNAKQEEKQRNKEEKLRRIQEKKKEKGKNKQVMEESKKQDEKPEKKKEEISESKKFDQSKIEIIKHKDEHVINLENEQDVVQVFADEGEGDVVYERTGFGWKGLGTRRIVFDKDAKQYRYLVLEPTLSEEEIRLKDKLIHLFCVRADVDVFDVDSDEKVRQLQHALEKLIVENHINITPESKDKIFYYIYREFIGYGKIDIMMHDEVVEDISCDGKDIPIFIYHKTYENIKSNVFFNDSDELDSFVIKLSQMCGKQISVYEPIVDGKLADGSRLQTTLGKTITKYSTFTIRRFREDPLTPVDLIDNNTMSVGMAAYFWLTIEKGASVLFCGGTASGKTTMLNALSLFLPSAYKIVSVEDTREINLPHENWIAGTTRTGFTTSEQSKTGKDIDMYDLIRVALRQRPRAIIVGEVRGKEAYSLFQAMTTGHLSYSTIHASDMHSLIQRLENPPISLPRALLTSLDMVIFMNSLTVKGEPVRRITNVTEIIKLDPETNRLVTISPFYWVSEIDDRFEDTKGSRLITKIKLENMWSDERLQKELKNRVKVLKWMQKNKQRSYVQVGKIISDYYTDPVEVLKQVEASK
jgi:archaeal flagellar protein FlaI